MILKNSSLTSHKKKGGDNMARKVKVGIGVWDLHYPDYDPLLWDNILKVIHDYKPNYFIFGGDNMNMTAADHWLHDKNAIREMEGRRIGKDYAGFKTLILKPLEKALPKYCKKIWHNGNHEDWIKLAIDKDPQGEGYWEIEKNLHLKKHGWKTYEYGEVSKIGKLYFTHGEYTNKYHAFKTVSTFERNIVYGHTHTFQVYVKTSPLDNEPHIGVSVPAACRRNPEYRKNRPNSWVNGFLIFFIRPKGYFNLYPIVAVNGQFVAPNGKLYT